MPPHNQALVAADQAAFVMLMRHLKQADPEHTTITVQVENESGVWGTARDYSLASEKLFAHNVPAAVAKAMGKDATGNWAAVFGEDADEYFPGVVGCELHQPDCGGGQA